MEFKLTTDIAPVRDMRIAANFDEVKAWLHEVIAPYSKLVLSEADVPNAKADLARIRKVKTVLEDYRKSVKRDFMKPVTEFEERVKTELMPELYEGETNLSEQINKYAEQRKAEKLAGLRAFFDDNIGTLATYLSFEQVQNPKWGNVTYTVEQAQQEIAQAMDMCADGVDAIRGLGSEFEATLLTAYAKNHDLAAVMKMNGELAETKKREAARRETEEARRREAEAARKEAEEREKARQEAAWAAAQAQTAKYKLDDEPAPAQEAYETVIPDKPKENVYTLAFRVRATRSQLVELRAAFDRIGIRFEKIEG
ncbi:MAG: DUF1351 domain-containing protein [Bacteroidaceae bacterium]|nr:DUF1351 domain-containing protein [Bacteroidaceae bacterium]